MKERYMEDDRIIEISEEVRSMSEEEVDRQIAILEAEARKEAENIQVPDLLQVWFAQRKSAEIIKKFQGGEMMIEPYILDDRIVEIPEYIRNMSSEERKKQIAILEEAGRREKEKIEAREKKKLCLWFNSKSL